jgi:hypothetical protein
VRFEQFDGTNSLPFKSQGRFHLGGNVITCPPALFKKTIELVLPIFVATNGKPCVIIPPMSRWLFAKCCNDPGHCTNSQSKDYAAKLLSDFLQLRGILIQQLVKLGMKNFRVVDTCCTTVCTTTASTSARLEGLRTVTASDGIHFTPSGCTNMVNRCIRSLHSLLSTSEKKEKSITHFWKGFRSTKGSSHVTASRGLVTRGRGSAYSIRTATSHSLAPARGSTARGNFRTRGFHPYRRK